MSSEARVALQPGYLLHRKPYRDTSLLLEVFTPEFGRLGLVARGAQGRRSSLKGILQPFQPLLLSWSGRGELASLTGAEQEGRGAPLLGDALLSGFYLNELLMRLLTRHDPHPELYACYQSALQGLVDDEGPEWPLRLFERDLLQELGYGLLLTHEGDSDREIEANGLYCYHLERGPLRLGHPCREGIAVRGATLLALASSERPDAELRREAKRLMRVILAHYLGPRPLASRELFRQQHGASTRPQQPSQIEEE